MNSETLKSFHVEATAICHLDFGTVEALDYGKISQQVMINAARMRLHAAGVKNISLVITEVRTEEVE